PRLGAGVRGVPGVQAAHGRVRAVCGAKKRRVARRQEERLMYQVKEIFYTLQGEGMNAGRPAVFCRFAGCNLWSGREADRASATCRFCDTDFVGTGGTSGGTYESADALAGAIDREWRGAQASRFVVLTGGEPALQTDPDL